MTWTPAALTAALNTAANTGTPSQPRVHVPTRTHAGARSVHLTRRGRVAVLLALVTLLLAAFSLGKIGTQASPRSHGTPAALATTTVHPGESLWAVARRVAPGQDPRGVIARLQDVNHLDGATVRAGQLLLIPRG